MTYYLLQGHTHGVDWWAIGILIYEMTMGAAPFTFFDTIPDYNMNPTDLYKNILNRQSVVGSKWQVEE